jgi:hypothetical protein
MRGPKAEKGLTMASIEGYSLWHEQIPQKLVNRAQN